MSSLAGKVCFVTGGSRGIGKGVATQLAKAGSTCYVTGRNKKDLENLAKVNAECKTGRVIPIVCDHAKDDQVIQVFKQIEKDHKKLDMLVNNAYSGLTFLGDNQGVPFQDQSLEAFDIVCNVGLRSHYIAAQLGARIMAKNNRGLIVNISSAAGQTFAFAPLYGIGKCAKDRMALDCSYQLKKHNISFVSYWATAVQTELIEESLHKAASEATLASSNPQVRWFMENGQSMNSCGDSFVKMLELPHSKMMKQSGNVIPAWSFARKYKIRMENGKYPPNIFGYRDMASAYGFNLTSKLIPGSLGVPSWALHWVTKIYGKPMIPASLEL